MQKHDFFFVIYYLFLKKWYLDSTGMGAFIIEKMVREKDHSEFYCLLFRIKDSGKDARYVT